MAELVIAHVANRGLGKEPLSTPPAGPAAWGGGPCGPMGPCEAEPRGPAAPWEPIGPLGPGDPSGADLAAPSSAETRLRSEVTRFLAIFTFWAMPATAGRPEPSVGHWRLH